MGKQIVFDVVGTCASYDAFFDAIELKLGDKLRAEGIKPLLFGYTWIEVSSLEYTYFSISGGYISSGDVKKALFYRLLRMAGIEDPRKFATDEDRDYLLEQYTSLKLRPGVKKCFQKLRDAGFTISCLTTGNAEKVSGFFETGGVDMPKENVTSCDEAGVAKPATEVYKQLLRKFQKNGDEAWFAAAHSWDVSAAKRAGFKGAYCTVWEKEPCTDLFGEVDVMADTLPELADSIILHAK